MKGRTFSKTDSYSDLKLPSCMYIALFIPEALVILSFILELYMYRIRKYYKNIFLWIITGDNINNISAISAIIISLCISVLTMIMSIDSNSLLIKLNKKEIKLFLKRFLFRIGFIFIFSVITICSPFYITNKTSYSTLSALFIVLLVLLFIEVLKLGIQLYVLVYKGVGLEIQNIKQDMRNNQDLYDISKNTNDTLHKFMNGRKNH